MLYSDGICQKLAKKEAFTNSAAMCRDTIGRVLYKEEKLVFLAGSHFIHYEKGDQLEIS